MDPFQIFHLSSCQSSRISQHQAAESASLVYPNSKRPFHHAQEQESFLSLIRTYTKPLVSLKLCNFSCSYAKVSVSRSPTPVYTRTHEPRSSKSILPLSPLSLSINAIVAAQRDDGLKCSLVESLSDSHW